MLAKIASSCPFRAFLPLARTSAFMKPTLFIDSKKVFSCNAPPMHLNQSSMFFLITSSNFLFRTISEKAIVPPGLSTLYASLKTASLSGERLYMPLLVTTSIDAFSRGILSEEPFLISTFVMSSFFMLSLAFSTIS